MVEYSYNDAKPTWANSYLWPVVRQEIALAKLPPKARAFDLGCGNGATAGMLADMALDVVGVDPSESGIKQAKSAFSKCRFEIGSAYDDLAARYGQFSVVVSLEVVEHCYDPKHFARTAFDLVAPGGVAIISTPYHGYLKNVALAVSGKMDRHYTALWDGGHIKFFSIATLGQLLRDAGFSQVRFERAGRIPALAKSMIAIARK